MPTPPGFAQCSYELKNSLMSRSAFITFGVDPTVTDPNSVATSLASAFGAVGSLFACLDNGVTLQNTRVSYGTDGGEDLVGNSPQVIACTRALTSPSPNCAVLVHKTTGRGGRRGRGRMYLPWACTNTSLTEAGTIGAADVTAVQNAVNAWRTAVIAGVGPLVLLHRPSTIGTVRPSTPGPPNEITGLTVDPLIATQRRRLGR